MATVNFYEPTDMRYIQTWYGSIITETNSELAVSDGYRTAIYYGSFQYTRTGITGTLIGFQEYHAGRLAMNVSGLSVDAATAATLIQSNQDQALFGLALAGDDTITGSTGSDYLIGYGGNDTFFGGGDGGNDTLDGGTGFNTAIFQGARTDYTLTYHGNTVATLADSISGRDGTTTVLNVQHLQFADAPVFILNGDDANIARLYSAALGRTADANGLRGWISIYDNNLDSATRQQGVYASLAQTSANYNGNLSIAEGFTDSAEFIAKYGSLSNTDFVTQMYSNVLGRGPDPIGLNGWLGLMSAGNASGTVFTRPMVLVGFAESNENVQKTSAWLIDMSRSG